MRLAALARRDVGGEDRPMVPIEPEGEDKGFSTAKPIDFALARMRATAKGGPPKRRKGGTAADLAESEREGRTAARRTLGAILPFAEGWVALPPPDGFEPSPDQDAAFDKLLRAMAAGERVLVLAGPAGSGKSTLMRWFGRLMAANGWAVEYMAPTGKAAANLKRLTGVPFAFTIHGALYETFDETGAGGGVGRDPHPPCPDHAVVVCDEASMVPEDLHKELVRQMPATSVLLYVGDREQLPPVNGLWGPNFLTPTAVLETVHRQAQGSPILRLATAIRSNLPFTWDAEACGDAIDVRNSTTRDVVQWIVEQHRNDQDSTAITWTNDRRKLINQQCRALLGYHEAILHPGDLIVVRNNNRVVGMMNGEGFRIESCLRLPRPHMSIPQLWEVFVQGRSGPILVMEALIGAERSDFFQTLKALPRKEEAKAVGFPSYRMMQITHVDHAYCLTAHLAQGSAWDNVAFVMDAKTQMQTQRDREFGRRFLYTAVTRARKSLLWWTVSS